MPRLHPPFAVAAIMLMLAACGAPPKPGDAGNAAAPAQAPAAPQEPAPLIVTRRPGAMRLDTAQVFMMGPLVSTAGWSAWQVSYYTTVDLTQDSAVAAQSDSVFARMRSALASRQDTTAFMEAHVAPNNPYGQHGGIRFLFHKLPDGSWARVN